MMDRANGRNERQGWNTEMAVLNCLFSDEKKAPAKKRNGAAEAQRILLPYFECVCTLRSKDTDHRERKSLADAFRILLQETTYVEEGPEQGGTERETADIVRRVGAAIRGLRMMASIDQAELAQSTGMSASVISQLERQGKPISIETLASLAKAMSLPTWVLFLLADLLLERHQNREELNVSAKAMTEARREQ